MTKNDVVSSSKMYGVPLYGAAWIPSSASSAAMKSYVVLAGGGGEGRSGIPNALLVSEFDFPSNSLADQPVAKLGTGSDLPYRISVHPQGEGLICALPNSCRWFEWDPSSDNNGSLNLKTSEKVLEQLEDVGQQLALAFNQEGSLLAVGGEDGKLRVFKWPSMEIILDEATAHSSVKDLDFSPDSKYLVSVGSGSGRVWDMTSSTSIASLSKENGDMFGFCRFSHNDNQVLYVTAMTDRGGNIVKFNTSSWKRLKSKQIVRDPISSFSVSDDGNLLAVGTIEGSILVISSTSMQVQTIIKKAHLGLVTALTFSQDSRALLSASMDSSVKVTPITEKEDSGGNFWITVFIILLAAVIYFALQEEGASFIKSFSLTARRE
ncbi:guanyl-nucleotide exchange factor [Lithospermum erythrorhizon]|uniref:Guanyl-nucleotide exchange factor n=1 Tax=Lithospermum erythrorhizon TaxID=34254 RepID=A0AAV3Q8Q3_LITER